MIKNIIRFCIPLSCIYLFPLCTIAQPVPASDENIPFLATFGKKASPSYGDDDNIQIFFLNIPKGFSKPIYIRVFDPDCGGNNDEIYGEANTKTRFSIYGGKQAYSNADARKIQPSGNYNSGTLLATKFFSQSEQYDNDWYTFEPIYAADGEWIPEFNSQVIKIIAEGEDGDDGNLYRYYFSTQPDKNVPIEGANAFTFEYTFRMPSKGGQMCHLYPYIGKTVVSVEQNNFDWDNGGVIKLVSYEKKGERVSMSNDNEWKVSKHIINPTERERSLDVQFVASTDAKPNNNICFYITNQYGESMPFYTIPIGGKPVYKYSNSLDKLRETERYNKEKIYKKVK